MPAFQSTSIGLHLPSIGEQTVPIKGTPPPGTFAAMSFSQDLCPPHTVLFMLFTRCRLIAPAMLLATGMSLKPKQYLVCWACRHSGLPIFLGFKIPPRFAISVLRKVESARLRVT